MAQWDTCKLRVSPFEAAVQGEHALPRACPLVGLFCPNKSNPSSDAHSRGQGTPILPSHQATPSKAWSGASRGEPFSTQSLIFRRADSIFPINRVENMGLKGIKLVANPMVH